MAEGIQTALIVIAVGGWLFAALSCIRAFRLKPQTLTFNWWTWGKLRNELASPEWKETIHFLRHALFGAAVFAAALAAALLIEILDR